MQLLGWVVLVVSGCLVAQQIASAYTSYQADEVVGKSPSQLLALRGFKSEEHFVTTADGYSVSAVRIVHPEHAPSKRPVVFNHGLLEIATIWLIDSRDVQPLNLTGCGKIPDDPNAYNGTFYVNGPMMLSSAGYDVWLMSMRGTDFAIAQGPTPPVFSKFWNYSLDDFALRDVPAVLDYIRNKTGAPKVGYIGHSQATFAVFGLLATKPDYANIIEPVVALAPVAYFSRVTSIARLLYDFAELIDLDENNSARFPYDAKRLRESFGAACTPDAPPASLACQIVQMLIGGKGEKWPRGYYSHLPFFISWKILRHFGQLADRNRFQRYDYGPIGNLFHYGNLFSPQYKEGRITSKSMILVHARTDALSTPADVETFKRGLRVNLYKEIYIEEDYNHFDLITGSLSRERIFKPILEAFEDFEARTGSCANNAPISESLSDGSFNSTDTADS